MGLIPVWDEWGAGEPAPFALSTPMSAALLNHEDTWAEYWPDLTRLFMEAHRWREIRDLGASWPLFIIDADGRPREQGRLSALRGFGSSLSLSRPADWLRGDFADGIFPGVPWFLEDLRPQGFLGRSFAGQVGDDLGWNADINLWGDDVVLASLLIHGEQAPGNFLIGEGALCRALMSEPDPIPVDARSYRYDALANAASKGASTGQWAAGEQPKFTAAVEESDGSIRHVIVKFSEPVDRHVAARRWADLLICEHLASELLAEMGNTSAGTELVWSHGRLCLEVTRFDRVGAYGRRGCVTLAAWSDAHDGERDDWPGATGRMQQGGWVSNETLAQVRRRWWFGRLIANTDMHFGNLSFFLESGLPLEVTPNYDMLPMLYRPTGSGEVVARQFQLPTPTPSDLTVWRVAAEWANVYWGRMAEHPDVSDEFQQIARTNHSEVARSLMRTGAGD